MQKTTRNVTVEEEIAVADMASKVGGMDELVRICQDLEKHMEEKDRRFREAWK